MTDQQSTSISCLSEEELAELAFNPPMEDSLARRHVAACASCGATLRRYSRLKSAAAALPPELKPARDLWASTRMAVAAMPSRPAITGAPNLSRRITARIARMAIAAGIIGIAFALGRFSVQDDRTLREEPVATDVFVAATEVQQTGTAYLTALARLEGVGSSSSGSQGREAAVAVLHGATLELAKQGWKSNNLTQVANLLERERMNESVISNTLQVP